MVIGGVDWCEIGAGRPGLCFHPCSYHTLEILDSVLRLVHEHLDEALQLHEFSADTFSDLVKGRQRQHLVERLD